MNNLKLISGIILFSFLVGCSSPTPVQPVKSVVKSDSYYDERNENDPDRGAVLDGSIKRRPGDICEKEDRNHECREICDDIYSRRNDQSDCEKLTVLQIEKLETLHELLENPNDDDLASVDVGDLDVYLNISTAPFDKLIGKYSRGEAKEVMFWVVTNTGIARVIEKEEDDFDVLDKLLKELVSFSYDNIHEAFITKIDGGDRLMEVAIEEGVEDTIDWFVNYINEKNRHCEDEEVSEDCFEVYCKIGNGIDDEQEDDWLDIEDFEDYINDIIEDGINKSGTDSGSDYWGATNNKHEDVDDINDWVDDLCKVTAGSSSDLTR